MDTNVRPPTVHKKNSNAPAPKTVRHVLRKAKK